MRLLRTDRLEIMDFSSNKIPKYAILSHTWGEGEVSLQDVEKGHALSKISFSKLSQCCTRARADGFDYVWIDTCCIDKTSSAELSEAINSMFLWYFQAERCYAYLADVQSKHTIAKSRWFKRGWTLQELIAPSNVYFLNQDWEDLGTKESLERLLSACTGIPVAILSGFEDIEMASVAQRMSWAANRETTRAEDGAYCLMGIFNINMPLLYGEGERAFIRLQEEIMRVSDDHSLFAWRSPDTRGGLLATSPAAFASSSNMVRFNPLNTPSGPMTLSNKGIHLEVRFIGRGPRGLGVAILHCREKGNEDKPTAIWVRDLFLNMQLFARVWSQKLEPLDLERFRPSQYRIRSLCVQIGRMMPTRKSKATTRHDDLAQVDIYDDKTLRRMTDLTDRKAISRAAASGDEDVMWLMLTQGDVEPDSKDDEGETVLSHAVRRGDETVVKILLARFRSSVALKSRDQHGFTPLMRAVDNGDRAIVGLLLDEGADLEARDGMGQTPLMRAIENQSDAMIRLLLSKGADFGTQDSKEQTPLLYAMATGQVSIVRLLLNRGANFNTKNHDKDALLSQAITNGHTAIIQLLLDRGANFNEKKHDKEALLSQAITDGNTAMIQLLLSQAPNVKVIDMTLLSQALASGHTSVFQLLLDRGANSIMKDDDKDALLLKAVCNGLPAIVQLLLDRGADMKAFDIQTPLWHAITYGQAGIARLLLNNGASLEGQSHYGQTPMAFAISKGHVAMVELLLDLGGSLEGQDPHGQTPMMRAISNGRAAMVELLLNRGASQEEQDRHGQTPMICAVSNRQVAIVELLLNRGASLEEHDRHGRTPMMCAVSNGHAAMVELLLNKGADPNKNMPLWQAALKCNESIFKLLAARGADPDANWNGWTPLSWAADKGLIGTAKLLIENGVNPGTKDQCGRTPLGQAIANGNMAIVKLLL